MHAARRPRFREAASLAMLLLAASSVACAGQGMDGEGDAAAPVPALSIDTLDHGRFDLASQRGSWVVVNFWATWCSPCLKEIPDLSAFDAARDDVRVIGLAYEDISAEDMRAFLKVHPAGYPIALVDVYDPPPGFDTPRGLPTTHLVAPDGSLARSFVGPVTSEELGRAIEGAGAADAGDPG